ncbi:Uncharacterised protein [uncultured Clostridium sp.]|uniref:hypothetical protein n=1 Tax=uncultured Clostridium sp. TaxID=59620 RepID=UPI000821B4D4|nr:hypothetical protein [uncultured Clostridium sp.]SCJ98437.1 Uncharacterised protein [uncultured Clostridium sp.]
MSIKGNPAEKLYELLSNAKENSSNKSIYTSGKSVKQAWTVTSEKSVKQAWALTFDIDENDEEKVFLAVVQVIQQIETLKKVTNRMNSNSKDDFIKEITELEKEIMNIRLSENSYKLSSIIDEKKLMALKAISMGLDICNQYTNIEDKEVQEIREKIVQLINEIGELSIDDDLKKVVIYNLSSVNLMMENHKLYGIDEIRGTVEKSFGSIMLNKELSELSNKDTTVKKTLKKTLNLLGSINTVLTFSKNVAPMLPEASEIVKNFFL